MRRSSSTWRARRQLALQPYHPIAMPLELVCPLHPATSRRGSSSTRVSIAPSRVRRPALTHASDSACRERESAQRCLLLPAPEVERRLRTEDERSQARAPVRAPSGRRRRPGNDEDWSIGWRREARRIAVRLGQRLVDARVAAGDVGADADEVLAVAHRRQPVAHLRRPCSRWSTVGHVGHRPADALQDVDRRIVVARARDRATARCGRRGSRGRRRRSARWCRRPRPARCRAPVMLPRPRTLPARSSSAGSSANTDGG